MTSKKCLIIDSYGFIFRAFHVQKGLTSPNGIPVGAIYGFTSMLIKLLSEQNPTHIIAVFDSGGKNFRHDLYSEYKSHRPEVPEELKVQFPIAREVAKALNLRISEAPGYEADDLIASIATKAKNAGEEVIIVSSDKDLGQLMCEHIKLYDPIKGKIITNEDIIEKFGVGPEKIRDVLSLMGDKSDNIPGVPGFGPKTASELINQFDSFENLCLKFDEIQSERKRLLFNENIEKAKLSYELVGLKSDIDCGFDFNDSEWIKPDSASLKNFLEKYGFKSLTNRAEKLLLNNQKENNSQERIPKIDVVESGKSDIEYLSEQNGYISIITDSNKFIISSGNNVIEISDINEIRNILENPAITKILYNFKEYTKLDIPINSYEDISIMAYILTSGLKQDDLSSLFIKYLNYEPKNLFESSIKLHELYKSLTKLLFQEKLLSLYIKIDKPISYILSKIEKIGVKFDTEKLNFLSEEFSKIIENLEKNIFEISGKEFNIASPKQLGEILFENLKLPTGSKTDKTKSFSTSAEVLEELALNGYKIAEYLLKWRQISKLKNTYTEALPKLVKNTTGRIHTTLLQTSTSTGRLSSHEPNLQNIPVKTPEGEKIRNSLIVEEGYKLISADYSQIELRILAEIANIKELKEAFKQEIDIHTKTASQVFLVPVEEVTNEMRRKAKAINFGIIYGISGFGLAKQLNISRQDAKLYIEKYFETYPEIKKYMESTKNFAASNGYVENYFKRKCFVPLINSSNASERSFAERASINAPIQGTASDIVKIAMIKLDKIFEEKNLKTKMILQIHDELLFESPQNEVEIILPTIKKTMENACDFSISLKVDIEISDFWK